MRTTTNSPPPPYSPPRPHHTSTRSSQTRTERHSHTPFSTSRSSGNRRISRSSAGQQEGGRRNGEFMTADDGVVLSAMSQPLGLSSVHSGQETDYDESSFCSNSDTLVTSNPSTAGSSASQVPLYPAREGRWYRKYCNPKVPNVVVFGVVAAVFAVTYLYMVVVYRLQPTPVVDEAFHIPQAQKYCVGKFNEWDPKLTTLPGLYLFSIGITGPISWLLSTTPTPHLPDAYDSTTEGVTEPTPNEGTPEEVCSVLMLRLVNVIVAPCVLLTLHNLLCFMHGPKASEWSCLASSVNLVLLPPLFWFYSLYYTEPLAVMLVLVMFLVYCHDNHNMAAIMGTLSIIVRQTNIVWVLFLLALRAVDSVLRHLNAMTGANISTLHTIHHIKLLFRRLKSLCQACPWNLIRLATAVLREVCPYVCVVLLFITFVYINGGLVVGDRSAHQATLHFMQVFYFFLFVVFFSPSMSMANFFEFLSLCCKHPKTVTCLLFVTVSVIHNNTLVHPYLLADNRHYTFYLWNKLYGRYAYFRYFIAPVYLFGGHLVWNVCLKKRSNVFKLIFLLCVCLSVVPQKLLEPRYFILPFIVSRIQHSPSYEEEAAPTPRRNAVRRNTSRTQRPLSMLAKHCSDCLLYCKVKCNKIFHGFPLSHICWEFLFYLTINLVTLAVFGSKTFWWRDFAEPQRIMW